MIAPFDISLPLTIGVEAQKGEKTVGKTDRIGLRVVLRGKYLRSALGGSHLGMNVKEIKNEGDMVIVRCGEVVNRLDEQRTLPIGGRQQSKIPILKAFPYRICLAQNKQTFSLRYTKTALTFNYSLISNPKYVKNDRLNAAMHQSDNTEEWGLLSMDKSHRIIFEPKRSSFPIIGLWSTSSLPPASPETTLLLGRYLSERYSSKCRFTSGEKNFIYFVRVGGERRMPELFLVEFAWDEGEEQMIPIESEMLDSEEVELDSGERSHLEFTLRSDEKLPEKLQAISVSPIPMKACKPFLEDSEEVPDSPRFKAENDRQLQKECQSLRKLVQLQQIEINNLKAQLLKLMPSCHLCPHRLQRSKPNCRTDNSLSSASHSAKTLISRRLTQSDLNFDTSEGSGSIEQPEAIPSIQKYDEQGEVWNEFRITEA